MKLTKKKKKMRKMFFCLVLLSIVLRPAAAVILPTFNDSYIARACSVYCSGPILEAVQLSGIYNDSKTFVDMPMKFDPEVVTANFNSLAIIDKDTLTQFLNDNFLPAGSDIVKYIPADYSTNPAFLSELTDPNMREWASAINNLWLSLGLRVNESVYENPQRHSFLPRM